MASKKIVEIVFPEALAKERPPPEEGQRPLCA